MVRQSHFGAVSVLLAVLCVQSGCAGLRGGSKSSSYAAPHGNFELPVPSMGLTGQPKIQEGKDDIGGRVVFHDEFGFLNGITYQQLPGDATEFIADPVNRKAAVRGFLHDYALPELFMKASDKTEVLFEEPTGEGAAVEYFAVVHIPEGSALTDLKTGKRLDSTRGVLIFPQGGYMYMFEYSSGALGDEGVEEFAASARESIQEFRATVQFK